MTARLGILSGLPVSFQKRSLRPRQFTLPADHVTHLSICPTGQSIRILTGCAWITCHGTDILLEAGQQLLLPGNSDAAVISAIGSATVTLEITDNGRHMAARR